MSFLIVMVLLLVVMYVLMIRPQRQRQQAQQATIEKAGVGDDILTNGGIYGTITEADEDDIVVELAEGLSVHMTRRGIAAVLPPDDEEDEDAEDEDVVDADDVTELEDEAAVTSGEEAVTSEPESGPATADRR